MPPYYTDDQVTLHHGDCLDVLRSLPDCSVDAVICDPPYGLADHKPAALVAALTAWAGGDREHVPDGRGFMGRAWDAFVPPPAVWDECLRVLKPGGHLVAFAGTRTIDLMGLSIRMAGFEIRDGLQWLYGSGMPKGQNVSKALDKMAGAEREVIGTSVYGDGHIQRSSESIGYGGSDPAADRRQVTAPATDAARQWEGWNTSLKPSWEPIILARKPLSGTVAQTVLEHGCGALNIDATRVGDELITAYGGGVNKDRVYGGGKGFPAIEAGSNPHRGRWPANVVLSHVSTADGGDACASGCVEGCPVAELDQQSGTSKSPGTYVRSTVVENHVYGASNERPVQHGHADSGGASRFFSTFRYQAKAPSKERPKVNGVAHPTCKPLALMAWLVRLVTPPGGTVLDPFAGSGTTLEAAVIEGFRVIGVERQADFLPLIMQRIERAQPPVEHRQAAQAGLFDLP